MYYKFIYAEEIKDEDKIDCIKWCQISINSITYVVAWDFKKVSGNTAALSAPPLKDSAPQAPASLPPTPPPPPPPADPTPEDGTINHTLPFKVLGIGYKQRQRDLKCASEHLNNNKEVKVAIRPDPHSEHDKDAISVLLDYGSGWKVVGYIARELTCYLHPLIQSNSLLVTISHIRFRVSYLLLGYYLTINITKKGMWCAQVITASKKVS